MPSTSGTDSSFLSQFTNLFSPQAVQTPDVGASTQATPGGVSSAAAAPTQSILNRAESFLGISTLQPNSASVQNGNPATASVANTTALQGSQLAQFVSNPLDILDNPTYNFRLYLAPEAQLLDMTKLPTGPLYIIAQSGVTGNYYIKDVEIESVVGPQSRTRNIRATTIKMTLVEPQGISLIDKLIIACSQLGIKNINIVPMCLELTFKGYDVTGQTSQLSNLTRTWRVSLINIDTKLNEGGAEYELSFTLVQDYAFNRMNGAAIIQQQISLPITTVGKFFSDLGQLLTEQSKENGKTGQIPINTYKFYVSPEMSNWVIGQSPLEPNVPSVFVENGNQKTINLNTDMTLDRIVDIVLASTDEGNKMVNPSSKKNKTDSNPQAPKVSQIATITSKVEFNGFNTVSNDYNRNFSYYINKYDSFRVNIDTPNSTDQEARVQYLLQDALQKRYQYIFTGENTDILKLDLNLNNLWRAANFYYASNLQRKNNVNSKFLNPQNKQPAATTADDLRDTATQGKFAANPTATTYGPQLPTTNGLTSTASPITTASPTVNPALAAATTQAGNATTSSALLATSGATIAGYGATLISPVQAQTANTPGGIPVISGAITRLLPTGISSQLSSLLGTPTSTSSNKTVNQNTTPTSQTTLLETLTSIPASGGISTPPVVSLYSKQIDSQLDTTRIDNNIEQDTNLGRSIFGIVTNQLYGMQSSDLISVSLEIRGDPFWLGESDLETFQRLASFTSTPIPISTTGVATPSTPVAPQSTSAQTSQTNQNTQTSPTRLPVPTAQTNTNSNTSLTSKSKTGFANFLRGENCLFLTFNTPKNFNESTGFVDVQQADLFIGVYSVVTIIHTFSEGKFTQKLECIRDIQTDPKVLAKYANINSTNSSSTINQGSSSAQGKTGSAGQSSLLSSLLGNI